jgi:hypothetical protein
MDYLRKPLLIVIIPVMIFFIGVNRITAQAVKKSVTAFRIAEPPQIDAALDDKAWQEAEIATDFIQIVPYNGKPASFNTSVKFVYDDIALYAGAWMMDPHPDSILTELSQRDRIHMADYFGFYIDCFHDNLTAFGFFVTSAGVQVDIKSTQSGDEDESWDAVWQSDVKITDSGWIAEFKIPYSALRFPRIEKSVWGLQIFRNIMRYRENTSWNLIDREVDGLNNQAGELHGLENIHPPLRLAFVPYLAGYVDKSPDNKDWRYSFNYGMDLKYGISNSYTLDMTLIPDFGQVQSDDKVYNLTPFEIYYDEKRPFFMEGTELFNKGNLFYSRRLGSEPSGFQTLGDQLGEHEIIRKNPGETPLINATKVSGKNSKNLAMGFFNGMTANTWAEVTDTVTGTERKVRTESFTNYNMLVLEQALKNNSFVSFFNTNVYRPSAKYSADVTGAELRLADKSNNYVFYGMGNFSQKYKLQSHPDFGYRYTLVAGKISGNFICVGNHAFISNSFDPNDMGYLSRNNFISDELTLGYNIFEPTWKILEWFNELNVSYEQLTFPRKYSGWEISYENRTLWKNHLTTWLDFSAFPATVHDYFESRVKERYFGRPPYFHINTGFSPDYRHRFVVDFDIGMKYCRSLDQFNYWIKAEPRFRVNDNLMIVLELMGDIDNRNTGFVDHFGGSAGDSVIVFGSRDILTFENVLEANYRFSNKSSLEFRLRHYMIAVNYNEFFDLSADGSLLTSLYIENEDFTDNIFNIDLVYTWNFAPGSEINIVWKNFIEKEDRISGIEPTERKIDNNYFNNIGNTLNSAATNSFSVKVLYYLDYQYLKKKKVTK